MSTSAAQSSDAQDLEHIACAAPFVFLLVAAADGNIDKKELKQFSTLLGKEEFAILAAAMTQGGMNLEQLLAACQQRLQNPLEELKALAMVIDARLPAETARQFKAALLNFGHAIAKASGGFLGFGKKVDKQEAAMLALIALAFAGSGGDENAQGPAMPENVLNDELFPALKPADWVTGARGHVAMQGIFVSEQINDNEPVIGYVHDNPQTVAFVPADSLGDGLSLDDLHAHAMANLEQRLAGIEWQPLSFDVNVEGLDKVEGMALVGDYFAAEAILSENMLKKAHQQLDSAMLMAIVPQRGELFVTKLVSEENPERERVIFAQFAIKRYFNPEQAPIAPNVFIVRNGKIVGNVGGMDQIIAEARKMAEDEQKEEASLLEHGGRLKGTQDAAALMISVKAHCVETMLKNLQHVIRDYVQAVLKDTSFGGTVSVSVVVEDPAHSAANHDGLKADLDSMSQFLTDQFASLNFKANNGSPITVGCEIQPAAGA